MVQRYISHSISNTLHYSSEIHPYVGEFPYLYIGIFSKCLQKEMYGTIRYISFLYLIRL